MSDDIPAELRALWQSLSSSQRTRIKTAARESRSQRRLAVASLSSALNKVDSVECFSKTSSQSSQTSQTTPLKHGSQTTMTRSSLSTTRVILSQSHSLPLSQSAKSPTASRAFPATDLYDVPSIPSKSQKSLTKTTAKPVLKKKGKRVGANASPSVLMAFKATKLPYSDNAVEIGNKMILQPSSSVQQRPLLHIKPVNKILGGKLAPAVAPQGHRTMDLHFVPSVTNQQRQRDSESPDPFAVLSVPSDRVTSPPNAPPLAPQLFSSTKTTTRTKTRHLTSSSFSSSSSVFSSSPIRLASKQGYNKHTVPPPPPPSLASQHTSSQTTTPNLQDLHGKLLSAAVHYAHRAASDSSSNSNPVTPVHISQRGALTSSSTTTTTTTTTTRFQVEDVSRSSRDSTGLRALTAIAARNRLIWDPASAVVSLGHLGGCEEVGDADVEACFQGGVEEDHLVPC